MNNIGERDVEMFWRKLRIIAKYFQNQTLSTASYYDFVICVFILWLFFEIHQVFTEKYPRTLITLYATVYDAGLNVGFGVSIGW